MTLCRKLHQPFRSADASINVGVSRSITGWRAAIRQQSSVDQVESICLARVFI
jgi:hypothetical protein